MSVAESSRPLGTVTPHHLSIMPPAATGTPTTTTSVQSPTGEKHNNINNNNPASGRFLPSSSPMNNSPIVSFRNRSSMHKAGAALNTPQDMIRSFRMQHHHHHKTNSQPAPANSFTEETNPLHNIPIEVSRSGQNVRITALTPQALPEKFSPLPGVQHQPSLSTTLEETNNKTGTASTTANVSSL